MLSGRPWIGPLKETSAMALRINDKAPDFEAETTQGRIKFHALPSQAASIEPRQFFPTAS